MACCSVECPLLLCVRVVTCSKCQLRPRCSTRGSRKALANVLFCLDLRLGEDPLLICFECLAAGPQMDVTLWEIHIQDLP